MVVVVAAAMGAMEEGAEGDMAAVSPPLSLCPFRLEEPPVDG